MINNNLTKYSYELKIIIADRSLAEVESNTSESRCYPDNRGNLNQSLSNQLANSHVTLVPVKHGRMLSRILGDATCPSLSNADYFR